jgi:hypothetical protein
MDLSKLTPADGAVTLRGLERRYRGLFAEADEQGSPDELATEPAANGWTALEHIVAAAWDVAAGTRALRTVLTQDDPLVDPADVDPAARTRPSKPTGTLYERLAELGMEANALADLVDSTPAASWDRYGMLNDTSSRRVSALDVLRSAIDSGVTHLKGAEYVLDELRTDDEPDRQ